MIGDGGALGERQGMGLPRPQAGGDSGAARGPNGPQPMDGGHVFACPSARPERIKIGSKVVECTEI
jgi:hypothetical protein